MTVQNVVTNRQRRVTPYAPIFRPRRHLPGVIANVPKNCQWQTNRRAYDACDSLATLYRIKVFDENTEPGIPRIHVAIKNRSIAGFEAIPA